MPPFLAVLDKHNAPTDDGVERGADTRSAAKCGTAGMFAINIPQGAVVIPDSIGTILQPGARATVSVNASMMGMGWPLMTLECPVTGRSSRAFEASRRQIARAGTVFVNGPVGIFEKPETDAGRSRSRRRWLPRTFSALRGGDSVTAMNN